MVAMERGHGKYSLKKQFARTLPKPGFNSYNAGGIRLVQSQPSPDIIKGVPNLYTGTRRNLKQAHEAPEMRHRNYLPKKVYIKFKKGQTNNDQSLRFPLLGPSRQEAEQFFQQQEKAKLEEKLLGTPKPKREYFGATERDVSSPVDNRDYITTTTTTADPVDTIDSVFRANLDAFSVTNEEMETISHCAESDLIGAPMARASTDMISNATQHTGLIRYNHMTSLPVRRSGKMGLLRQSSRLSLDVKTFLESPRVDYSCGNSTYRQNTLVVRKGGTQRERTIVPSRIGYHPRSNSPTFKRLEGALELLEQRIEAQIAHFGATFSTEVSTRHITELCQGFEQSSYFPSTTSKHNKPTRTRRSISTAVSVPQLKFLMEQEVYESHFATRGMLVSSAKTKSSASTRRTVSIRLPPIDGPLVEDEEQETLETDDSERGLLVQNNISEANDSARKLANDLCSYTNGIVGS